MAAITQTITIVDKSNKVVSASKQLKNVFAEAKYAYQARKAEIKAERQRKEEAELQKAIRACSIAESEARSNRSRRRQSEYDDGYRTGDHNPRTRGSGSNSPRHMSLGQFNEQLYGQEPGQSPYANAVQPLQRRRTDMDYPTACRLSESPRPLGPSQSATDIDLDLAYGEFHEPDLAPSSYSANNEGPRDALIASPPEKELSSLVLKCKMLLEEADCAGQSVKAIVTHLQENPDAMAAVALTLAEISNIAAKVAPGALTALKGTAPAVIALLASPEFLVAVGLGLGVTVVMFGGYKIIKKIKAKAEGTSETGVPQQVDLAPGAELLDVKELDRIEKWRRGIDVERHETNSVVSGYSNGTSVEGEFITPFAQRSMGHLPLTREKKKPHSSSSRGEKDESKEKKKKKKHSSSRRTGEIDDGTSSVAPSESGTVSGSRRRDGASGSENSSGSRHRSSSHGKELIKIKKPSPLRRMFTTHQIVSSTGSGGGK